MSRWFRLYDDTINDPKILKLPEVLRWYWIALLCVASKCGGNLPPLDDIAIQLRVTQAKATEVLASLVKAGLLDRTETGFVPHNWHGRQYKSSEDKPTKGKDSYVYFVGASWGAMIKIGFSKNPWARLVNIQTSHHEKVVVLAAFRCKSNSEVALHDLLKPYRRQGEWFDLPASVSDTAKRYADERKGYEELVVEIATLLRSATTEAETETEAETDSEAIASGADAPRKRVGSRFNEFWAAYPRRDGPNPRKPAEQRFTSLVKSGVDPGMMVEAAKKLAVDEAARGNVGTRFIPQAVTWLNQQRWADHSAVVAEQQAQAAEHFASQVHVKADTPQWRAWAAYLGKPPPQDRHFGWYFESEWPPGHAPVPAIEEHKTGDLVGQA